MSTVRVKQNDIGVTFTGTLTLTTSADWSGATVKWIIRNKASLAVYSGVGTVTGSGTSAEASYTTVAGDLAEYGTYDQEWEVTFTGGSKITFPSGSYNTLTIVQELA